MRKRSIITALTTALALVLLLMTALVGCGKNDVPAEPDKPDEQTEPSGQTDPAGQDEPEEPADTGRKDGERFEKTIILEGMEETVKYEHVKNETAGFELDFDYELFKRISGADSERFVSIDEESDDPVNYLEVTRRSESADTVAAEIKDALANDFDTVDTEQYTLDLAGQCELISASGAKGDSVPNGSLQTVYIIPAADGCIVATIRCTYESAEGFGARFSDTVNTIAVIGK